ncbi:hypothetical protein DENSPDRAFT_663390 [Dentipellis sp. KUC8613]|nr:hypothetical protein DENSPDRAFT_663390 [Dentipellis sp. KUC8613]
MKSVFITVTLPSCLPSAAPSAYFTSSRAGSNFTVPLCLHPSAFDFSRARARAPILCSVLAAQILGRGSRPHALRIDYSPCRVLQTRIRIWLSRSRTVVGSGRDGNRSVPVVAAWVRGCGGSRCGRCSRYTISAQACDTMTGPPAMLHSPCPVSPSARLSIPVLDLTARVKCPVSSAHRPAGAQVVAPASTTCVSSLSSVPALQLSGVLRIWL